MDGKSKKIDPFKTRKTNSPGAKLDDTVDPPSEIMQAIDDFREAQDQAKHFEGQATLYKDSIVNYCKTEFSKRHLSGQSGSFKLLGEETMVTFVVQDASAGLTEEDISQFASDWGQNAADELIERDYKSIRFNDKVLKANYDLVVSALQQLPEEVLSNLFKPMLMRAKPGALEAAKKYAKTEEQFKKIVDHLKMRLFIR